MDESELILHEAEMEGRSMLGHLRPGDEYRDPLVRRLDGSRGGWLTVTRFRSDGSEGRLGPNHRDRTCWIEATDEDDRQVTVGRPIFNLYLSQLNHPDSIAELRGASRRTRDLVVIYDGPYGKVLRTSQGSAWSAESVSAQATSSPHHTSCPPRG